MARGDHGFMELALAQALRSSGCTWPNPGVGCVLVRSGRVIGHGRHERCGGPHAEINALADCAARGYHAQGATAYVTLAPCTRHGRTPPCAHALVAAGVARVVAALQDPNQDPAAELFSQAGILYQVGVGERAAQALHGGFLRRIAEGRPRLTAKWAMTLDGMLAAHTGHSGWISSREALDFSRRRRKFYDAILVGAGTARADNPRLLAEPLEQGRTPLRIVLAGNGDVGDPDRSQLWTTARQYPVLVVLDGRCSEGRRRRLERSGMACLIVADVGDAAEVAQALGAYGLNDVLIEGGATVHGRFLRAGLYDRVECYLSPLTLGGGFAVASGQGVDRIEGATRWEPETPPRLRGGTLCWTLRRKQATEG